MQFKSLALLALAAAAAPAIMAQTAQTSDQPGGAASLDPAALAKAAAQLGLTNATSLACTVGCVTKAAEGNGCPKGVSDPACYCDKQKWLDDASVCTRSNCTLNPSEEQGGIVLLNQTCSAALAPKPYTLKVPAANSTAGNGTKGMAGMGGGNSSEPGHGGKTPGHGGKPDGALGARLDSKQLLVAVAAGLGGSVVAGLALL